MKSRALVLTLALLATAAFADDLADIRREITKRHTPSPPSPPVASSRLRVRVANATAVDTSAIHSLGLRGVARPAPDRVHVLVGPSATEALTMLRGLVGG